MPAAQQNIQTVFDDLLHALSLGWLHTCTAKRLQQVYQEKQLACARYFFLSSYQACAAQSLEVLGTLSGDNTTKTSFHSLLEAAHNQPGEFPYASSTELSAAIQDQQVRLSEIAQRAQAASSIKSVSAARLTEIREDDEAFARLFQTYPLEEITESYQALLQSFNLFHSYFQKEELEFEYIDEEVKDDIEFIMTLMSGGCF